MEEKKTGRGGAREGAGRPRELDEGCKPRTIYCSWSEKQDMERFLAFRRAIEKAGLNPFSFEFTYGAWYMFINNITPPLTVQDELPDEVIQEVTGKLKDIRQKEGKYKSRKKKS